MIRAMKTVSALVLLSILASCGLTPYSRSAWHSLSAGVAYYCGKPPEQRAALRHFARRQTHPHRIEITCDGD